MSVRTEVTAQQRREWIHDGQGAAVRVASIDAFFKPHGEGVHKTAVVAGGKIVIVNLPFARVQELILEASAERIDTWGEVPGGGDE